MIKVRQSELIVNLNCLKYNILSLQEKLTNKAKLMPVIKANAYGLGVAQILDTIQQLGINQVAVAIVDEGIELRELGFDGMIFILNQPDIAEIPSIVRYNLIPGVSSSNFIEKFGKSSGRTHHIHIEIGTGMGRTGIRPDNVEEFINLIRKYENIKVDGIYTHFSCSDCDDNYTKKQISNFNFAVEKAKELLGNIRYIHACNSAGIVNYPEAHYTLVRPGIMLYGYLPEDSLCNKIELKPSVVLKSKITYIKEVPPKTSIGYGRTFVTKRTTKVATIPLGYADGIRRALSNNGNVVINNKLAPIIGRICMDSFMVDITDLDDVVPNNDVYIWDNKNITLEQVSEQCDTINYEILSTISYRVPRKYVE